MSSRPLHLHSMMVHAVIALALLGSAAFVLVATGTSVAGLGPDVWDLLLTGSVVAVAVIAIPSTVTGIIERDRMYANWHPSHRAKLVLSAVLLALAALEIAGVVRAGGSLRVASPLGLGVVVINPVVALALSYYGLRITVGRQGWGPTSYVPDMRLDPQVDILERVAEHAAEDPKLIDVLEEQT